MSNVKMKMKAGFSFPPREETSTFGSFNYPKIECIKYLRAAFGLSLRGAKDLVEAVVENGPGQIVDVCQYEGNVDRYHPAMVRADVSMEFLGQYFEFVIEGEVTKKDEVKAYRKDLMKLLTKSIGVERFNDARTIVTLIEDLTNDSD
jgi:hypothetical protein